VEHCELTVCSICIADNGISGAVEHQ